AYVLPGVATAVPIVVPSSVLAAPDCLHHLSSGGSTDHAACKPLPSSPLLLYPYEGSYPLYGRSRLHREEFPGSLEGMPWVGLQSMRCGYRAARKLGGIPKASRLDAYRKTEAKRV